MAKKKNNKKPQNNPLKNNGVSSPLDWQKALKEAKSAVKQLDKRVLKSVPKGMKYDWLNNTSFNNVIYQKDKIPDRLLRLCEKRNGIVGAIVTLRIQQAIEYSKISHNKDVPGWEFSLRDDKAKITPEQEKQKKFLEDFFNTGRRNDYENIYLKPDDFKSTITKYVRDRLLIDKICWEIERDNKGQAVARWVLDGATIIPVLPGGFYGSTSQIGRIGFIRYNKLSEEIEKARIEQIPPVEEIAFVQELLYGTSGGGIAAAFREDDLIYDLANELNDIRYFRQGMSVTEKANVAITAFINSITFNSNGLSRGAIPKIAVAMGKDSNYTQEQLEDAQDEWAANFESVDGQWNIPLLNSDAKILNLLPNNRDMEYQKYMEFAGALICSEMGADPAEAGLRLNQAQNVMSENQDAKQLFSKNRGTREILGGFAYIANKWRQASGFPFAKDFVFRFNGLSTEDKGFEADLRKKDVETIKTVDEVRAEVDLPPLPDGLGEVILNAAWMQNKQSAEMEQQQQEGMEGDEDEEAGFGGFTEEETDNMVDEAMSGLNKAVKLM
jgi:hypothetical protein